MSDPGCSEHPESTGSDRIADGAGMRWTGGGNTRGITALPLVLIAAA